MRNFTLIGFSEIDKNAIKAYCQLNNVDSSQNYGDICTIGKNNVEQPVDMLIGGTPCQSFTSLGTREGCLYKCSHCSYSYDPLTISVRNRGHCPRCGKSVSEKSYSSLMIEYLRLVRELRPKIIIWENVSAVATNKKFKDTFSKFVLEIQKCNYKVRCYILKCLYFC
ncbi:MAG: DNA cytosine methyltransferase [Ruminococcus sp.]|nr:DNA cytosine methyltransferase [Ruminococcus sp.]